MGSFKIEATTNRFVYQLKQDDDGLNSSLQGFGSSRRRNQGEERRIVNRKSI